MKRISYEINRKIRRLRREKEALENIAFRLQTMMGLLIIIALTLCIVDSYRILRG